MIIQYAFLHVFVLVWYGLLSVRGGVYEGAVFKFKILIPANYPDGGCPVSHTSENISMITKYRSSSPLQTRLCKNRENKCLLWCGKNSVTEFVVRLSKSILIWQAGFNSNF